MALVVPEKVDAELGPENAGVRILADRRSRPLRGEAFFSLFEDGLFALGPRHALELLAELTKLLFLLLIELAGFLFLFERLDAPLSLAHLEHELALHRGNRADDIQDLGQ